MTVDNNSNATSCHHWHSMRLAYRTICSEDDDLEVSVRSFKWKGREKKDVERDYSLDWSDSRTQDSRSNDLTNRGNSSDVPVVQLAEVSTKSGNEGQK
jgi:hypothetical protein